MRGFAKIFSILILATSGFIGGFGACNGLLGIPCEGDDPGCNLDLLLLQFVTAARINNFPTHMYVLDATTSVNSYTIDRTTGIATAGGLVVAGTNPPADAVLSATGDYLYVASQTGANGIYAFELGDPANPVAFSGNPFFSGSGFADLTVDASANRIYAQAGNQLQGYSIQASTGALSALNGNPFGSGCIQAIEYNAGKGILYEQKNFTQQLERYAINAATGAATSLGASNPAFLSRSMDFTPDGRFFFATNQSVSDKNLFVASTSAVDGSLTATAGSPLAFGPSNVNAMNVDVASDGKLAYVANVSDSTVHAFTVDTFTGAITQVSGSPLAGTAGTNYVKIAPGDDFLYVGHGTGITIYSIAKSGALTEVGSISGLTTVRRIVFRQQSEFLF